MQKLYNLQQLVKGYENEFSNFLKEGEFADECCRGDQIGNQLADLIKRFGSYSITNEDNILWNKGFHNSILNRVYKLFENFKNCEKPDPWWAD